MSALAAIFWGTIVLSIVVFIHEGGHYVAARIFGARVLEFFIGLPSRASISRVSKRNGTRFGITSLPFGGYARIAGMEGGEENPHIALVLTLLMARGSLTVDEAAQVLDGNAGLATEILFTLGLWGSAVPVDDKNRVLSVSSPAYKYLNPARDSEGLTIYDAGKVGTPGSTLQGEPESYELLSQGGQVLLERERKRTYRGLSVLKRVIVLGAGVLVNIVFALALLTALIFISGIQEPTTTLAEVQPDSIAQEVGIQPGDKIVSIGGQATETWTQVSEQIVAARGGGPTAVEVERNGEVKSYEVEIPQNQEAILGIVSKAEVRKLSIGESLMFSVQYAQATAIAVLSLLNPSHAMETISGSVSVVGIAVEASNAAALGPASLISLLALISLSLGMMNLLPIPPLDGGKIVIEIVQGILGRPISTRVQTAISLIGISLFGVLFFYLLFQDIVRYVLGG